MASTAETKAKAAVHRMLKSTCEKMGIALYDEVHAGESFSSPTLDITGTFGLTEYMWGIPWAIEVKRFDGKGKLTARQAKTLREMRDARIAAVVIASEQDLSTFQAWIESRCTTNLLKDLPLPSV